MSEEDKYCPVCATSGGGQIKLTLRQINAEEAIYVCDSPACCYPVGYDVPPVKRPVLELLHEGTSNKEAKDSNNVSMSNPSSSGPLLQSTSADPTQVGSEEVWDSGVLDSLLDPAAADFFDSFN